MTLLDRIHALRSDPGAAPCVYARPGRAEKTGCGRCRQRWLCSHPRARDAMPPGGWPESHCLRACKYRQQAIEPQRRRGTENNQMKKAKQEQKILDSPSPLLRGPAVRIAGVFTAFNEGEEVRRTVEDWLASLGEAVEPLAIVVDDGSRDGSCSAPFASPAVRVLRHDRARGVGRSRNDGLRAALEWNMNVVAFHDAHMRFPEGVIEALARKAVESGAIVCSKAKGWWDKDGKPHAFVGRGADLHWNLNYGLQPKYRVYARDSEEWTRVPCPMGACYVMSRETVRRLMGPTGRLWDDVEGRWGFSEQALALKAFLLGIPVLVSRDLATHHRYGPNPAFDFIIQAEMWRNVCFATAALLSEETFERRFRAHCEVYLGPKRVADILARARERAGEADPCWPREAEERIWTHLCGRSAPITAPHPDHAWLADLRSAARSGRPGLRILQWRPGESTVLLRRLLPAAEITALEWVGHRVQNWQALLQRLGVKLLQTDLDGWTNPLSKGFLNGQRFDLITIGGELAEECMPVARGLLAPGGRILVNPTADALQIEDAERRKAAGQIDKWKDARASQRNAGAGRRDSHQDPKPVGVTQHVPRSPSAPAVSSVTVVLLNWRRPENIVPVLRSLAVQTARPRVMIWDNGAGEAGPLQVRMPTGELVPVETVPIVERVVRPDANMGCFPRWWLAAACETEYVCSIDDDLALADARVLEDAISAQRGICPDGIIGLFGVRLAEGKSYKDSRHYNGRVKADTRVDIVKGRFMLFPRRLLERVPLHVPGVEQAEDDLYVSLAISRARPDAHLLPATLSGRWRRVGKEDARSNALRPGHYGLRDDMIRRLQDYWWRKEGRQ